MIPLEIRFLNEHDDLSAVSRVYEQSWKYAYRGIIPQAFLDNIEQGRWSRNIVQPGRQSLLLLDEGRIVGTSSICPSRFEDMAGYGEIISIYLLPEYMGKGCGVLLMNAAVDELFKMGFQDIFLYVLEENHRARRFYETFGFQPSGRSLQNDIGGKLLTELQYVWHADEITRREEIAKSLFGTLPDTCTLDEAHDERLSKI